MTTKTTHKGDKKPILHIAIIILLVANLGFSVAGLFTNNTAVQGPVADGGVLEMEQLKAGGEENFAIMQKIFNSDSYKAQQKQSLQAMLDSLEGTAAAPSAAGDTAETAMLDSAKVKEIIDDAHIVGSEKARYTILEYSELHCPYCQRQHNNNVIADVLEEFDGKVNSAYRHFIVHPSAQKFAEAAECIADIKGIEGHTEYLDKAFKLDGKIDDTSLSSILKEMKVDEEAIQACLDEQTMTSKVKAETTEGRSFGVSGTPGNVILDTKTGRYVVIPGAYPKEKFIEEINNLIASE